MMDIFNDAVGNTLSNLLSINGRLLDATTGFLNDIVGDTVNVLSSINDNLLNSILTNVTLFGMLLVSFNKMDNPFPKTKNIFAPIYDYIVVGGGTAGSVMASRLSENPCASVLLIEAGGYPNLLSEVPVLGPAFFGTDIDWSYQTSPQEYCCSGQIEKRVNWNSGKGLGGGSILNAMLYSRGNKKNYDDWDAEGCTGWSYDDVLPYFLKLEDNKNIDELDPGFHRTGGPMTMEKPNYTPEMKNPIIEASAAMGYELTDTNGRRQTGVYDLQGTLRNGQRCSTAKAYLVPADERDNLTILKRAFARKIIMEGTTAKGVEFDFRGKTRIVRARKEVIISSGSTRTPQILMLSGIGPKEELEKFNIPVVLDLPAVGKNLQDHCTSQLGFTLDPPIKNVNLKILNDLNILQYIKYRSGPLASPASISLMSFLDGLKTTATSPDFPRQELYFVEYRIDNRNYQNLKPEVHEKVYGNTLLTPGYTCLVSLLQPCSVGEITLKSADPYDHPIINPNYYKCKRDLDDVVEGLKICHAIGTSEAMKEIGSEPRMQLFPGCEDLVDNQTAYFECVARSAVSTIWHPAGTARCGQPNDPRSVVDPQLRVIGTKGLRVVSAAMMPIVPSGNTNVPTMMVAEKAYDMMKDDINCNPWHIFF